MFGLSVDLGSPLHLLESLQIGLDGLVQLILGCVLLLKPRPLLFPRMGGDFTSRGTVLVQLSAGFSLPLQTEIVNILCVV